MRVITIEQNMEKPKDKEGYNVIVTVNNEKFETIVENPFTEEAEEEIKWYFEDHMKLPTLNQPRFKRVRESIISYGESLFEQVFKANNDLYFEYKSMRKNRENIRIQVKGSTDSIRFTGKALKILLTMRVCRLNTHLCVSI